MTTTKSTPADVVVVDGSNIATEGRSMPSLTQLNDAVMAFRSEFPDATITVIVDATFGHRIDKSEVAEFDEAIAHNELVAPPAGAIGRGDAFVLSIANKVGARILSNDSFQEFHGQFPWLFDEGRLIGGKPVPHVGWVFVPRLPVKGPTSRKATRGVRGDGAGEGRPSRRTASKAASQPMPVPKSPPPGRSRKAAAPAAAPAVLAAAAEAVEAEIAAPAAAAKPAPSGPAVNDLLPFIEFVERHPVGSSVNGVVESYSSHGAYVMIGDLRGYVPLRLMGDPPPRRAREVMKLGDAVTLVVTNFTPARRSVDLGLPALAAHPPKTEGAPAPVEAEAEVEAEPKRTRRRGAKRAAATDAPAVSLAPEPEVPAAQPSPSRRRTAKKTGSAPAATDAAAGTDQPAAATRAPGKRSAAKKAASPATTTTAKPARKQAAPATAAKSSAAKRSAAKSTAGKSTAAKASASKTSAAEQPAATKPAAKKASSKQSAASTPTTRTRKRAASGTTG